MFIEVYNDLKEFFDFSDVSMLACKRVPPRLMTIIKSRSFLTEDRIVKCVMSDERALIFYRDPDITTNEYIGQLRLMKDRILYNGKIIDTIIVPINPFENESSREVITRIVGWVLNTALASLNEPVTKSKSYGSSCELEYVMVHNQVMMLVMLSLSCFAGELNEAIPDVIKTIDYKLYKNVTTETIECIADVIIREGDNKDLLDNGAIFEYYDIERYSPMFFLGIEDEVETNDGE